MPPPRLPVPGPDPPTLVSLAFHTRANLESPTKCFLIVHMVQRAHLMCDSRQPNEEANEEGRRAPNFVIPLT